MLLLDGFSVYGGRTLPIVCQWLMVGGGCCGKGASGTCVRCCSLLSERVFSLFESMFFTFFIGIRDLLRDSMQFQAIRLSLWYLCAACSCKNYEITTTTDFKGMGHEKN